MNQPCDPTDDSHSNSGSDGHGHRHGGHCDHHHGHAPAEGHGRAFAIAIVLNALFVGGEFCAGLWANSTALLADAGHNLSDVLSLLLAWGASALTRRAPAGRYTYGLRHSSILAALGNALLLMLACGAIAWEAVQRFGQPPAVAGLTVMIVAGIGIVVNGASALLFMRGSRHDVNVRGAYLHLAGDAAVSLGVVLAGAVMLFTGWYWLDPALSLVIVAVIAASTWGLLRESVELALQAVPRHIDIVAVDTWLRSQEGVTDLHDLHIWAMSTTESALTAHMVMPAGYPGDEWLDTLRMNLHLQFDIDHSTVQVEHGTTAHACALVQRA